MCKPYLIVITIVILLAFNISFAEVYQLDLIYVVRGLTDDEELGGGVCSPGDLTGAGYSEVFVGGVDSVKVFNGGNPADTIYDYIYPGSDRIFILNDLNGDGESDIAIGTRHLSTASIHLYLSGPDFYNKTTPDLTLNGDWWEGFGSQTYSSDTDNDEFNELSIAIPSLSNGLDGKFYIFETTPGIDTIPDDSLVIVR